MLSVPHFLSAFKTVDPKNTDWGQQSRERLPVAEFGPEHKISILISCGGEEGRHLLKSMTLYEGVLGFINNFGVLQMFGIKWDYREKNPF